MKLQLKYLAVLVFFIVPNCLLAQADAGPDKDICKGKSVQLGGAANPDYCYYWTPQSGLDNPNSPNPMATPDKTTSYTLIVTGAEFSGRWMDEVTVSVFDIKDIVFDKPMVYADGVTVVTPQAVVDPPGRRMEWDFDGEALGCWWENEKVIIGTDPGTINVRVFDNKTYPECYLDKPLEILDPVKTVTAEDIKSRGRIAKAGETLFLVGPERLAEVIAEPSQNSFTGQAPVWSGTCVTPSLGTSSFTNYPEGSASCTYTAGKDKSVTITRLAATSLEVKPLPGFSDAAIKKFLEKDLTFKGSKVGGIKGDINFGSTSYKRSLVGKYMDPGTDYKHELNLGFSGSITGKIVHPLYSKKVTSPWGSAKWELYFEAKAALSIGGGLVKDPSTEYQGWSGKNLAATLDGTFKVGFDFMSDAESMAIKAGISATVKVGTSAQLLGNEVQLKAYCGQVQGALNFEFHYDINDPKAKVSYNESIVIFEGLDSGWHHFMYLD
ncbi:MAG: hypothetical protein NVV82_00700 [Sporocytophaga sp.]|nr:hypothetical protein [Sporocytophaga sp.]